MKKIIAYIVCGILVFFIAFFEIFDSIDTTIEDKIYHVPNGVDNKIRIIKIDDKTMNKYGDISKWDRDMYADLVETLCVSDDVKPALIGFDVLFSSTKDEKSDKRFVEVCKKNDNVVCGFSYTFTSEVVVDKEGYLVSDTMVVDEKVVPYKELEAVTSQGFVNALIDDKSNNVRSAFMYYDEGKGVRTKSFGAEIYERYQKSRGENINYPTKDSIMTFRYSGGISNYENVSMCDVLDGSVPASTFDDCIVLVGAYAAGMMDSYFIPFETGKQMYGVEIHANVIQALLEGKNIVNVSKVIDALIAAIVAVLLLVIGSKVHVLFTTIICVAVSGIKLFIDYVLFNNGYSINHINVPLVAFVIAMFYGAVHYIKTRKAKKMIEQAFSKYVAPQVVTEIAKDGSYELKLGGEKKEVAVLFVDIRGFTSLSEKLEPEQVVNILNNYLELTTSCIFKHGGTLDKFIGDATMAVFNAPFNLEDYLYKAICAAMDIVKGGSKIEEEYKALYGVEVGFGVGINCGPAVVGNIGCEFRMDYTTIGDTVNTAERLEANAPKGNIYISHDVYELMKNRIHVREIGNIPLKGKKKDVLVYSVIGLK